MSATCPRRHLIRRLIAVLVASCFAIASAHAADVSALAVGQMWSIKNSSIRIVIGRIEPFGKDKSAISISVFDVPCPPEAGCKTTVIAHVPFDAEVLARSVDSLISTDAPTARAFDEGYANWKRANGGIFTIPAYRLPELVFKTVPSMRLKNE